MNRNVGPVDARLRIAIGVGCVLLALLAAGGDMTIPVVSPPGLGIFGAVLVVEGAMRRCLLYRLLRIDRCPVDR